MLTALLVVFVVFHVFMLVMLLGALLKLGQSIDVVVTILRREHG